MKYLPQVLIILLFTFLGELLHFLIPLPIPASIYGMILLFLALILKIIPVKAILETGNFLVSSLSVLFVVPLVNLMDYWAQIKHAVVSIILVSILSTILIFAVSGKVTQWILDRKKGGNEND